MARVPLISDKESILRHERDTQPVVKPSGAFKRSGKIKINTDRSPAKVTKINPENMEPILPEMPYIPPA